MDKSDTELTEMLANPETSKAEKRRVVKEQKSRDGNRNKQKRKQKGKFRIR